MSDTEATKADRLAEIVERYALPMPQYRLAANAASDIAWLIAEVKRDADYIASLGKALDYLRGENRRLTAILAET